MRKALVWLAVVRILLGLAALPLAPLLYRDHFLLLVLLRPTKEVLLAGGYLARQGDVPIIWLVVAALPLMVLAVWQMYYLGRSYAKEIRDCDLPGIGARILPPARINKLQDVLRRKGEKLVVIGRLAAFPSSLVGAAAGSSGMRARTFMRADGLGTVLALAEVVGAGYLLGEAHDEAGPWLAVSGAVALVVLAVLLGRYLRRA